MKPLLTLLTPLLFASLFGLAQKPDYKVVFDLTSKDPALHQTVVRWINAITKETVRTETAVEMTAPVEVSASSSR